MSTLLHPLFLEDFNFSFSAALSVVSLGELLAEPSRAGGNGAVLPSAAITASAALKTTR